MTESQNKPSLGECSAANLHKIQAIYTQYWGDLCRYLRSRFGPPPEPEDIAQMAFMKYAEVEDQSQITSPKSFLFRTASNLVIDYHRSPKNVLASEDEVLAFENQNSSDVWAPEHVYMNRQELAIVERVIMGLSERDRAFVLMNRLKDMTYTEIAEQAGMSRSGVQKIITQALERCVQALKREAHEH